MHNSAQCIFLYFITLSLYVAGYSQNSIVTSDYYTRFYTYTTIQGLSCSEVLDVMQDKYGFIWVATKNGLNKFDGQLFTQYFNDRNNASSLCDNLVTCLAEDIYGTVWIGTVNGLCKYVRNKNCFEEFSQKNGIKDIDIRALYADNNGNLWIDTRRGGLNCLKISTNQVEVFPHSPLSFEGDYFYHFIFEDSKHRIWIGGRNFSPKFIDIDTRTFLPEESFDGNDGSTIFEDINHTIWISGNYGINYFNEKTGRLDDSTLFQFPFPIISVLNEENGKIWFGGNGDRVYLFDQEMKKWNSYSHNDANPFSIASTIIHKIYRDKQNNIWFATPDGLSVKPYEINKFRHYRYIPDISSGPVSNKVTALLQDKRGTIWVGTQDNGIDTFNIENEQFGNLKYEILQRKPDQKTFLKENAILKKYIRANIIDLTDKYQTDQIMQNYSRYLSAGLKSKINNENHVSALYEDSEGTIYIGLWNGIGFNKFSRTDGFKREFLFVTPGSTLFNNEIAGANWYNDFLEDRNKNFWIATWEGIGLNLYNREKNEFEGANFSGGNYSYGHPYMTLLNAGDSMLWLNNSGFYLGYIHLHSGRQIAFLSDQVLSDQRFAEATKYLSCSGFSLASIPLTETCSQILTDNNRNVWVIFNSGKITRYNLKDRSFTNYTLKQKEEQVISAVYSSEKKSIYLATISGHVFSFSLTGFKTSELQWFKNHPVEGISCMAWYDNKLWIGHANGLLTYQPDNDKSEMAKRFPVTTKAQNIKTMAVASERLYLSCSNEILAVDRMSGLPVNLSQKTGFYPQVTHFTCLYPDGDYLWAGSDNGLFKINLKNGKFKVFEHEPSISGSIPDNEIIAFCRVKNELYVSTRKGLCKIDLPTDKITLLNEIPSTILSTRLLTRLMEDRDGYLWIGTSEKGINRMNPVTRHFEHFYEIPGDSTSLSGNNIESIFQDSDNNIWVGTDKALNRFCPVTKTFSRISAFDGLNLGPVKSIKEDKYMNIWISTGNGLIRFNRESQDFTCLTRNNGIQDNTFSNAAVQLHDGRLAFGGINGITVFDPDEIIPDEKFPTILTGNVKINDTLYMADFSGQDTLLLDHNQNNISCTLGSSEFFAPGLIRFKYRLSGFENQWSFATIQNNLIKYNNLRPGRYRLEMMTNNTYGKWDTTVHSCFIRINKPWWVTWWFLTLSSVLFLCVLVSVIRIREHNLIKTQKELERKISERTVELDQSIQRLKQSETDLAEAVAAKDMFFSIIAHDLKNPVLALKYISDKLVKEFDKLSPRIQSDLLASMNHQIHLTYSFLDNLLLWALSQKNAISFNPCEFYLTDMVTQVIDLLRENAQLKSIRLMYSIAEEIKVYADKNMVMTILNNLINNAIKFSYPEGKIMVSAKEGSQLVKISIEDEGIGIPEEHLSKLFKITSKYRTKGTAKESGTGTGLLICKEFVERNGGKISVECHGNKKTIFYFTLPNARRI